MKLLLCGSLTVDLWCSLIVSNPCPTTLLFMLGVSNIVARLCLVSEAFCMHVATLVNRHIYLIRPKCHLRIVGPSSTIVLFVSRAVLSGEAVFMCVCVCVCVCVSVCVCVCVCGCVCVCVCV